MRIARAAVFVGAGVTCCAQSYDVMYAKITGGSGDRGKCTIEVTVDGSADIEILSEQGRMKTVSGQRPVWQRLECNRPLPTDPADFRFNVQNGRAALTSAPSRNRGVANIRATSSTKFDLEWVGAASVVSTAPSGEGYFRDFRAAEQVLTDAAVKIDGDRLQLELTTSRGSRISFTGTIILKDRERLVANMSGGTIQGSMEMLLNGSRVDELAMTGVGVNRFEMRWQRR